MFNNPQGLLSNREAFARLLACARGVCGVSVAVALSLVAVEHPLDTRARVVRALRLLVDGYGVGFTAIARECGLYHLTVRNCYYGKSAPGFDVVGKLHDGVGRLLRAKEAVRENALRRDREVLNGVAAERVGAARAAARLAALAERERLKNLPKNADESP